MTTFRRRRILPSTELPFTPQALRAFLSIDSVDELPDAEATEWISATADRVERALDIALFQQRWEAFLPGTKRAFEAVRISVDEPLRLLPAPLLPVNFRVYVNTVHGWVDQTEKFELSIVDPLGGVSLKSDQTVEHNRSAQWLRVVYEAGYERPSDLPAALVMGIKARTAFSVENSKAGVDMAQGISRFGLNDISFEIRGGAQRFDLLHEAERYLRPFYQRCGLEVPR